MRGRDQPADVAHVREHNLGLVVRLLRERGPISRTEIAQATGLVPASVTNLVGDLAARGLIREPQARRSAQDRPPGRPRTMLELVPDRALVLAVQVQADTVTAELVPLVGPPVWARSTEHHAPPGEPEGVVGAIGDLLAEAARRARSVAAELVACAVAMPGPVEAGTGVVAAAIDFGWHRVALADLVARRLGDLPCPLVLVNDANAAALAEYQALEPPAPAVMLYVKADVGVGGGVVVDGRIFAGEMGFAGEIGHVSIDWHGRACFCGSVGCVATYLGPEALLEDAGMGELAARVGTAAAMDELERRAAAGDPRVVAVLAGAGQALGAGVLAASDVVNPGVVVLGGYLPRLLPWLSPGFDPVLDRRPSALRVGRVPVLLGRLGSHAALAGAAELGFERLLDDPSLVPELDRPSS